MFTTIVLIQILGVSAVSYVNFAMEEPCPEKYYGTSKCYVNTFDTFQNSFGSKKRIYIKKPWASFDEKIDKNDLGNQNS